MEQRFLDINKRPTSFRRPTLNLRPPFHPQQIRSPDENSIHQDAIKLFWSSAIGFFGKDINIPGLNIINLSIRIILNRYSTFQKIQGPRFIWVKVVS